MTATILTSAVLLIHPLCEARQEKVENEIDRIVGEQKSTDHEIRRSAIEKLLEDERDDVRDSAVGAWVDLDARDQIARRLGHQYPHVRQAAREALKRLDEMKK